MGSFEEQCGGKSSPAPYDASSENYAVAGDVALQHSKDDSPDGGRAKPRLKHSLQGRHLKFLALGGSIGTGLFVGSGNILATGGPASLMIDFIIVSLMLVTVIFALGEMVALFPVASAFSTLAARFIDPSLGFSVGLSYLMTWLVILPVEITAGTIVIGFWDKHEVVPQGVWVVVFLTIVFTINMFGVRGFGEFEFAASFIKIVSIVGFIICAIVIDRGGTPAHHVFGVETWRNPGAFNNAFKGFCTVFVTAAFAYGGSELVGLAAAEAKNPRVALPNACKQVVWRVLVFYLTSLLMVTLIVPYTEPGLLGSSSNPRASPFVIALQYGGVRVLPHIFNGVILVSVLSVANSSVFASSRILLGLAERGEMPKIFAFTDKMGRPLAGYAVVFLFGLLGFLMYSTSKSEVFAWLTGISGLSSIFIWGSICASHIRFRSAWKNQGYTLRQLPWASPLGVYGSWFGLVVNIFVICATIYVSAFPVGEGELTPMERAHDFFVQMVSLPVALALFLFHKLLRRTRMVPFHTIDLVSERRDAVSDEVLEQERAEARAQPLWKRVLAMLF
ncbi:hypothetical protein MSPP1_000836 [Malassezia sp. CBS 17886]|nr:hypothetical protein MSPP1_000836 [Malassezia sp. CBS 17886]